MCDNPISPRCIFSRITARSGASRFPHSMFEIHVHLGSFEKHRSWSRSFGATRKVATLVGCSASGADDGARLMDGCRDVRCQCYRPVLSNPQNRWFLGNEMFLRFFFFGTPWPPISLKIHGIRKFYVYVFESYLVTFRHNLVTVSLLLP